MYIDTLTYNLHKNMFLHTSDTSVAKVFEVKLLLAPFADADADVDIVTDEVIETEEGSRSRLTFSSVVLRYTGLSKLIVCMDLYQNFRYRAMPRIAKRYGTVLNKATELVGVICKFLIRASASEIWNLTSEIIWSSN